MSFRSTCRNIRLDGSSTLCALCERGGKLKPTESRIDLDKFLGNSDGSFRWGDSRFSATSTSVTLSGTILRGTLRSIRGKQCRSSVDLDERIANVDGKLVYQPNGKKRVEGAASVANELSAHALENMWSSPTLANANSLALPPPGHLDDTFSQLQMTFLPKTQHKAVHVVDGSQLVEPTMVLFCPIEGGEYVIDATVKELAKKTDSEVQVIDMAQVAAGEWGAFGKSASGFRFKNNPLGKVASAEDLDDDDDGDSNLRALESFWCKLIESNPPACATASTSESIAEDGNFGLASEPRSRIIYIRDFGLLAPRVNSWFPSLYSAVRARRTNGLGPESLIINPTTIIFGYSPPLSLFPLTEEEDGYSCCPRSSAKEWEERSVTERAERLQKLKKKWDKGKLLKDLPPFYPKVKVIRDKPEEKAEIKHESTLEAENEDEKPNKVEEDEKSEDSADQSDSEASSHDSDQDDKQTLGGYFRSSVIAPAKRNSELERTSREARRRELNELMLRMAVGAKGGEIESATAPVPVKEESKSGKAEKKDKNETDEDGNSSMLDGWSERLLKPSALEAIVDRALEAAALSNQDDKGQERVQVSWTKLQDAWRAQRISDEERKTWTKDDGDSSDEEDQEGEGKSPVDPIVEKVKSANLDEYERRLIGCIVDVAKLSTTFENVHLPAQVIDSVRSIVSLPLLYPKAFKSGILKQQAISGALLFGPPGTGKTLVVRALAKESGSRMLAIKPSDIADKWVGETEKLVRSLFKLARRLKPCVVFIDEIDSLMGSRKSDSCSRWHTNMLTEFMQEMDGLIASSVIVIGATNRPFDVDDAVLRRLPCRLLVDLPGVEAREEILKIMLRDDELAPDVSISELARKADRFSGSDLKNLCVAAAMDALKENVELPWAPKKESDHAPATELKDASNPKPIAKDMIAANDSDSSDESSSHLFDLHSKPSSDDATTPEEKPEVVKPRILAARHFLRAFMDVAPSSSESQGSLSELRKWNTQFGTGARDQPRSIGSLPYSYGSTGSSGIPGTSGVPSYSYSGSGGSSLGSGGVGSSSFGSRPGMSGLGSAGLGSTGFSGSGLTSSGFGSTGLGSTGLGFNGLGSNGFSSLGTSGFGSTGPDASGSASLSGMNGFDSTAPSASGYTPPTYTPPSMGGASAGYTPRFPVGSHNILGHMPTTPGSGLFTPQS